MHYIDTGNGGPPVVMVHGNPTWSYYYRNVVAALRDRFRCIVPDHIGCGLSDKPGDDEYEYVLERRVADLEALLDHLGLDRGITLIVHDWGGMIGMAAAARRPERFARFVILNTAAFPLPAGKRLPWRLRLIRDGGPLAALAVRGFNAFARGAASMATTRGLPDDVRRELLAPYDSWAHRIATLRFVQDIPLGPGDRSYALVQATAEGLHGLTDRPMLICWGMRDFVFDEKFLDEWRRRFPNAVVRTYPDAGHYVLEDARDSVIGEIDAFLAGRLEYKGLRTG